MGVAGLVSRSDFRVVNALNAEWAQLSKAPGQPVDSWGQRYPALTGCSTLADVLDAVRADSDHVLTALLREHRDGDVIAGRTVLQQMLGRIVVMARRDGEADIDDYVAALWLGIHTYPLAQRPTKIVANLALDTLKLVKKETRWGGAEVHVATLAPGEWLEQIELQDQERSGNAPEAEPEALTATGVIEAAGRLGLIDGKTRAVLLSVYSDGLSGRDAADRHETSPAMIRHRCSKAVRRLAQHAAQLSVAA